MIAEPTGSTLLIPKPTIGHHPEVMGLVQCKTDGEIPKLITD
jgi:hypothetical protein